jgi:uncharacterized protein involved in exopolysaccharide biosynthesis
MLATIGEHKRFILQFTVFCAALSIAISLILPKSYTATLTLLPPQQNSSLSSMLSSQLGSIGGVASLAGNTLGLKNPNDTLVAMLKSRTVEDAMVKKFDLMAEYHKSYLSDARKAFEHVVSVDGTNKDGLIHVSVEDQDPQRAADLANGYVDQSRELSEHLAITEASQRRLFFERQLASAKDNLANAEEDLAKTEQKTGVIELSGQTRALIESAASLRAQIAAKEVQIQGMKTYATAQNAQLIEAQQELDGLNAQLAKLAGAEEGGNGGLIVTKGQVPEAGLEYVRKLRDVKYYETIFNILARQFELAKLDEAKEGALIQVVDPAIPPDKRSFPQRGLIVIVSTLAAFLFSVVIVLWRASLDHLRRDPETSQELIRVRKAFSIRK